jgi:hypothetical protein
MMKETGMKGETSLQKLLATMSPGLIDGEYVFCTIPDARYGDYADTRPIASFTEYEGLTLVMSKNAAENAGLSFEGVFRCITLGVHSSLEAVGLTAAVAGKLAEYGIAANVIAAYFHDHVFVQTEAADRAIGILSEHKNN